MSIALTGAEIAAAVANEGGYGTIGGAGLGMSPEIKRSEDYLEANQLALANEIKRALKLSDYGNIGVNLMVAATDYDESVKTSVESGVKYIVSGAGLPLNLPNIVKESLADGQEMPALIPIVSSVRAAEIITKKWARQGVLPSAFIVETPNTAGGHLGVTDPSEIGTEEFSLERVVPELVEYLKSDRYADLLKGFNGETHEIPIIAAGGMWDRADINKTLKLGAAGVQMATRFLIAKELNASQAFKDRHLNNTDPIVVINSPVGMPGRAIENEFVKKVERIKAADLEELIILGTCVRCLKRCGFRDNDSKVGEYCIMRALDNVRRGDVENGILFVGTNGDKLKQDYNNGITTTAQIMQELTSPEI
jgi:nitronate monooxygenase